MQHITDAMVDAAVTAQDAQHCLREAFRAFGDAQAAMQQRIRTEAGGLKLSTLGAVIPGQQVAGAKVYTTIAGQFSFVILLFSAEDGRPLASFDAAAITRLRTAACSVIAAGYLARPDARTLALFGAGVQGRAHLAQFAAAYGLDEIRVCSRHVTPQQADTWARACGVPLRLCTAAEAVDGADLVVTASRAQQALFAGEALAEGAFVAAVGSSLPHTRELDDAALRRAALVAVEWRPQSLREAGDLVLAAPDALGDAKIVELGALVCGRVRGRTDARQIMVYKSVGVGLEDVALAGLAWRRLQGG
ncbi:ornithine cyclodeaminase family protein [Pseudorhodoferax sp. Leaf265]|uniref:ornithine cyclodeaminase family protein n=1 Tax=Pseudorhodoferax sp. Leaf265 TaxID=1736315 RepID=UPI00070011AA|nr:ornithine cyclodeaminase family protein [Pseudorhodoferax sp. Leaf265]KQP19634.1 ornithine cyclodeaminase [Pseudorhodoferax sp. Leaf265]